MFADGFSFSEEWEDSDTVIYVEGGALYVHKAILTLSSPVFRKMLSSDFIEKATHTIELPGKKKSRIVELLTHIYPYPPEFSGEKFARKYSI